MVRRAVLYCLFVTLPLATRAQQPPPNYGYQQPQPINQFNNYPPRPPNQQNPPNQPNQQYPPNQQNPQNSFLVPLGPGPVQPGRNGGYTNVTQHDPSVSTLGSPVFQSSVSHMNRFPFGAAAAGGRPPMGGTVGVSYGQDPYNSRYGDNQYGKRVMAAIQLTLYSNPQRLVGTDMVCYDDSPMPPQQQGGNNNQGQGYRQGVNSGDVYAQAQADDSTLDCQLQIVVTISTPGIDPPQVISTVQPMQLTAYRTDLTLNDNSVDPRWQQPYFTNLTMRPRIDIVVLHTGTLRFRNNTWPYRYTKYTAVVDTFSISANDPSIYPSQGPRQYTLQGYEASTRLSLNYNYDCLPLPTLPGYPPQGTYSGPDCDLVCNYTQYTQSQFVQCRSDANGTLQLCARTGAFQVSVCVLMVDYNVQVQNCQICYLGFYIDPNNNNNQRCNSTADYQRTIDQEAANVSYWWTIAFIFIFLFSILALLLCCVCGLGLWRSRRNPKPDKQTSSRTAASGAPQPGQSTAWASKWGANTPSGYQRAPSHEPILKPTPAPQAPVFVQQQQQQTQPRSSLRNSNTNEGWSQARAAPRAANDTTEDDESSYGQGPTLTDRSPAAMAERRQQQQHRREAAV